MAGGVRLTGGVRAARRRLGARSYEGSAAGVTDAGGTDATDGRETGQGDGRAKIRRTEGSITGEGSDETTVEAEQRVERNNCKGESVHG